MFKRALYILWLSFAAMLVTLAILSSVVRMLSPIAGHYRETIEKIVSDIIQQPVQIGQVSLDWHWFQPVLKFEQVDMLAQRKLGQTNSVRVEQVTLGIDLFSSLLNRHLQPGLFVISGADIYLHISKDGQLAVNDFEGKITENFAWVFAQKKIELQQVSLHLQNDEGSIFPIKELQVYISNNNNIIQLIGSAKLSQTVETDLSFSGCFNIRNINKPNLQGKFFIEARDVLIAQWLNQYDYENLQVNSGKLDLQLWLNFASGKLTTIQSQFLVENLSVENEALSERQFLHALSASVLWQQKPSGWELTADQISLRMAGQDWPNSTLLITQNEDKNTHTVFLQYLNINHLARWLSLWESMPAEYQTIVSQLQPEGTLENVYWQSQWSTSELSWTVKADIHQLAIQSWEYLPAASNLSGKFYLSDNAGRIVLSSKDTIFHMPTLFPVTHLVEQIDVDLSWHNRGDIWQLASQQLSLTTDILNIDANLQLSSANDKNPKIQLTGKYNINNLAAAKQYLPNNMLDEDLYIWLNDAIVSSGAIIGDFKISGDLNDVPFKNKTGIFQVNANINNLDLNYTSGWPIAKNLTADLTFNNNSMSVLVHHAELTDIPIETIDIHIPDLSIGQQWVHINGQVKADSQDIIGFIKHSPLNESLTDLAASDLTGDINLDIKIEIPLSEALDEQPTRIKGQANLTNNQLTSLGWTFDHINGLINFNEKDFFAKGLSLNFYGKPAELSIKQTADANQTIRTRFNLSGHANVELLSEKFQTPLFSHMSGDIDYQAQLFLADEANPFNELLINTELSKVKIDLPKPLYKAINSKKPLMIHAKFAKGHDTTIDFIYNNYIAGSLAYDQLSESSIFTKANIQFGSHEITPAIHKGLTVSGAIDIFDFTEWHTFISQIQVSELSLNNHQLLNTIDLTFEQMKVLGHTYHNVDASIRTNQQGWQLSLNSALLAGVVTLPQEIKQGINAQFSKLVIAESILAKPMKKEVEQSTIIPGDLPRINLVIDDFVYGTKKLGQLELKTKPVGQTLEIEKLKLNAAAFQLHAVGAWQKLAEGTQTILKGYLSSNKLSQMLTALDLPALIDSQRAQLNYDFTWPNKPSDFTIAKLTGSLSFHLNRGNISQINEETKSKIGLGKILSILSLQTLPRRLALDFSDWSNKGFSYDRFAGEITLKEGIATIKKTYLDGPVAYAEMHGNLNLVLREYDILLKVSPYVAANLPILATLAGGPIVGAATWLADKLVIQPMQRNSAYTYTIRGDWDKPVIEELILSKEKST